MKSGRRAVYKGMEYEYIERDNGIYELYSTDSLSSNFGFNLDSEGYYIKYVSRKELDDVYYIDNYASYKGYTFSIWEMKDDEALLALGDSIIAKAVGFPHSDLDWERGLYKKWIKISEIDRIWEEKKPL